MRAADTVVVSPDRRAAAVVTPRHAAFIIVVAGIVAWFWAPLVAVMSLSLQYDENYSHIVAIPFVSAFLLYLDRRTIFGDVVMAARPGAVMLAVGIAGGWLTSILGLPQASTWSVAMLSLVVAWLGAFIVCYGTAAFRKARFPLLFLLLMIPVPPSLLAAIVSFLQHWSAEATAVVFDVIGVAFYRQGYVFSLAGLTIEIAEECSGIRSGVALFITSLLAGHLFLRTGWSKTTLAGIVIPLAIVKNAVRIVVLTMLAIHVDPSFITASATHRYSGIPLFAVTFAVLGGIVWILQRTEGGRRPIRVAA